MRLLRPTTLRSSLVLAALVLAAGPAWGTINLTHAHWRVLNTTIFFTNPIECLVDIAQSGTVISAAGNCDLIGAVNLAGTIDSATGAFTVSGTTPVLCTTGLSLTATAAPDGLTFSGTFSCTGALPVTGPSFGTLCGNGFLETDLGEQCDDHNLVSGDCCSATCKLEPAGASCTDDFNPCTTDQCNASGVCLHAGNTNPCDDGNQCTSGDTCSGGQCIGTLLPVGTACDDFDACTTTDTCDAEGFCQPGPPLACNACQTCDFVDGCVTFIDPLCHEPDKSVVKMRDQVPDDRDLVVWKHAGTGNVDDFGDPAISTDYTLCVYDDVAAQPAIVAALHAPAGGTCGSGPCWAPRASGFRYRDAALANNGLSGILLSATSTGRTKISLKGKGGGLGLPATLTGVDLPVKVQLKASNGQCWNADYPTADKHNPVYFTAHTP